MKRAEITQHAQCTRRGFLKAGAGLSVLALASRASGKSARPNLLIIHTDQQSCWTLGAYGGTLVDTPHTDSLARDGAIFRNFFTNSAVCTPSRGCLLTGRYPQRNGMPVCSNDRTERTDWYEDVGLPQSEITIAELLKPLGYASAAYGKWHLGEADKFAPRKQGFDEYIGRKHNFHVGKPGVWFHNEEPQGEIMFREAHQKLTDATIEFMTQQRANEKPFFIYLAHYLVRTAPDRERGLQGCILGHGQLGGKSRGIRIRPYRCGPDHPGIHAQDPGLHA